jgi:predicted O-methyltransferase YrrM
MWGYGSHAFLIEHIRHNHCKRMLEIGVADGENAKAMVRAAIENVPPAEVEYYGFDYFSRSPLDRVRRKLEETGCLVQLVKGDSVDTLPRRVQALPPMDVIFIDGGKSYAEATSDWTHARTLMHHGTVAFVHNYGFSGVQRMVDEIDRDEYSVRILHPPHDDTTAMITMKLG